MNPTLFPMPDELESRLKTHPDLPSPPKVAMQVIQLVKNPDLEIEDVVKTLSMDPALCIKLLRQANSPYYAYQNKVNKIDKAIMVIGLNGVLSLALSFSLAKSLQDKQGKSLDYSWFWLRALVAGSVCRSLGQLCKRSDLEEMFTLAFIQDIGMLAIDQVASTLYGDVDFKQTSHAQIINREKEEFGTTHPIVGSWLLHQWNFPETFIMGIRYGDDAQPVPSFFKEDPQLFHCLVYSSEFTELYLNPTREERFLDLSDRIINDLGIGPPSLVEILNDIGGVVAEKADLFEIQCPQGFESDRIIHQARELLTLRVTENVNIASVK